MGPSDRQATPEPPMESAHHTLVKQRRRSAVARAPQRAHGARPRPDSGATHERCCLLPPWKRKPGRGPPARTSLLHCMQRSLLFTCCAEKEKSGSPFLQRSFLCSLRSRDLSPFFFFFKTRSVINHQQNCSVRRRVLE